MQKPAAPMFSVMCLNIFLANLPLRKVKRAASSIRPEALLNYWWKCLNHIKAGFLTRAAVPAGCLFNPKNLWPNIRARVNDISIYGQESNQTTWRLAKMNLAIRGIDSSQVKWNNEGSFLNDAHKDLKADFVIANPPFNDSDWSGDLLRKDGRWKYGVPPSGNANYAWIQHFLYHLSPSGIAGFVLAKGSLDIKNFRRRRNSKSID